MAAATGALVQAMTTDAWQAVRGQVAALFGRGGREEEVTAELEIVREEVTADGDELAALTWLRRTLRANPEFAAELRELLVDTSPRTGLPPQGPRVSNQITGETFEKVFQAENVTIENLH
ncbi:hypothetical protein ASE03_08990 [Kitasatospora sp. Root187]|nr:hypothetical protein ASC99_17205 [Kitasatospora sp. Root107]KRB61741.1 hypothetical protein ASE03_08990 [Kitasatospora sp. Root187]